MGTHDNQSPLIAAALCIGAVVVFVYVQETGLWLRRAERRAWWAGTGRDLLNAAGLAVIGSTLWLSGFPPPVALLVGGVLALTIFGAYVLMATQVKSAWPRTWTLLVGLLAALPVLIWPSSVLRAAGELMALFAGPSR
jgi:hypothetical protein